MPRPENPELKRRILEEADRLFRERGYTDTSYGEVAKAAGIAKGLVQYHFKRKQDLAFAAMDRVLGSAAQALGYGERPDEPDAATFGQLYRIGQAFFAYLLRSGYRRFLADVVGSLDLLDSVLAFNLDWALGYARLPERTDEREVVEAVVRSMGGFYSLMHYDLAHGMDMDVARHLRTVMSDFMLALGYDSPAAQAVLGAAAFAPGELDRAVAAMTGLIGR